MKAKRNILLLAATSLSLAAPSVYAGQIWDGGGTNNNWTSPANWDGNVSPNWTLAGGITFTGETRTSSVNNLTAATTVAGFNLTNDGSAGKTAAFSISGTSITLGGNIATTASSSTIADSVSFDMILNGNRNITTASNHNLSLSGIISQADATNRNITKLGVGTLTLSNTANTFAGQFLSDAGTVQVTKLADGGTASSLGAGTASIRLGSNATATLEYIGDTDSSTNKVYQIGTNTATNTGNAAIVNNGTGKLTFTAANFNSTAGGAITVARSLTLGGSYTGAANVIQGVIQDHNTVGGGTVSVTKNGASTWALSGANTYTGATNVNAGTLVVNGNISTSSLTTVADGAIIGGSGTVGALTVADGGTLAPGNSPGTLSTGTLTLSDASNLNFELNPTDTTVGSDINDLISVTGDLTLDGLLTVVATSGDFLSATVGTSWRLFNYTGTLIDNGLTLSSLPSLSNDYFWEIDTATAGQVNLVVATTVIPEPGAALLGGLGLLALFRRRRN